MRCDRCNSNAKRTDIIKHWEYEIEMAQYYCHRCGAHFYKLDGPENLIREITQEIGDDIPGDLIAEDMYYTRRYTR